MALVDSPSLTTSSRPLKTGSLPAEAYVLSLASLPSHYAAAASFPINTIHLFDKATLRKVLELPGHHNSLSCLKSVRNIGGSGREALLSCGKDGIVKVWDERSGSVALESKLMFDVDVTFEAELKESMPLNSACISVQYKKSFVILRPFCRWAHSRCRNRSTRRRCTIALLVRIFSGYLLFDYAPI